MVEFQKLCRWTHQVQHQQPREGTCLEDTPLEILLLILDHLDAADRACLARCNRFLAKQLGTSMEKSDLCRGELLLRWCRQHPKYYYYHSCKEVLKLRHLGPPKLESGHYKRCKNPRGLTDSLRRSLSIHYMPAQYNLGLPHVQLAMLRFRYGPGYGIPLDALSWTEIRTSDFLSMTTLLCAEPRIVAEECRLRIQQWQLVSRWAVENTRSLLPYAGHLPVPCAHMTKSKGWDTLALLLRCRLHHAEPQRNCRLCHPYLQCCLCATTFRFDVKDYGHHGIAVIMTKWLNLGRGMNVEDWQWTRHLDNELYYDFRVDRSTEDTFERQPGPTVESLIEENFGLLRDQLYKSTFKKYHDSSYLWHDNDSRDVWIRYPYSFTKSTVKFPE